MIELQLRDGRVLVAEDITFSVKRGDEVEEFAFEEIDRIALLDGNTSILAAQFGGMPVRVMRYTDASGLRVDFPLPVEAAAELGKALQAKSVMEVARKLPPSVLPPA